MTWRAASSKAGFLLVEALTAMAIGALLLVALSSLVSLVLRASDRTAAAGQDIEETSRIFGALVRETETISPQRWAGAGAGFVFEGTETGLIFARYTALPGGGSESRLVILNGDGPILTQEERTLPPYARGIEATVQSGPATVLQRRFSVRFAYFSRLDNGQEALTDTWSGAVAMPVAVRISLADRDGRLRGTVRVPVLVDAEPGCAAPGRGLCSFVLQGAVRDGGADAGSAVAPVNAEDTRGWGRYLRP